MCYNDIYFFPCTPFVILTTETINKQRNEKNLEDNETVIRNDPGAAVSAGLCVRGRRDGG